LDAGVSALAPAQFPPFARETFLPLNYSLIVRQAGFWLADEALSTGKKKIARDLFELASVLSDPDYGCRTEYFAVETMVCHLCRTTSSAPAASEAACRLSCPFYRPGDSLH
jgi:hypothetical protein